MQQTEQTAQSVLQAIQPLLERLAHLEAPERFVCDWLPTLTLANEALLGLGAALVGRGAIETAHAVFAEVCRRDSSNPVAQHNRGVTLQQLGHFAEAAHAFRRAAALQTPAQGAASIAAEGVVLRQAGELAAAEQLLRRACELGQDTPDIRWNLALTLLNAGRYGAAWPLFESRYERPDKPSWAIMDETQWPMWRGEDLSGKRLLVVGEQGLGDQIQFASLLPLVAAQASEVEMLVSPGVAELFAGLPGLKAVHAARPRHLAFDYWVYLLSLPLHLGLDTPEKLAPGPAPFAVDAALAAKFASRLHASARGRLKVGLVWAGNPAHANDRFRSMPLDQLAPLLALDVCWVGLQRDLPARDRDSPWLSRLENLGPDLASMADTAAALSQLDLLISIDSAPAHLAASLKLPTWVLLPQNVDWRWPRSGATTFWYAAMRLYHQRKLGDWSAPLGEIRKRLARMCTTPAKSQ